MQLGIRVKIIPMFILIEYRAIKTGRGVEV
jgi:hypothetical protein